MYQELCSSDFQGIHQVEAPNGARITREAELVKSFFVTNHEQYRKTNLPFSANIEVDASLPTIQDPLREELRNFSDNDWKWDKHPSYSPDSRQIVFWSNCESTKQIYVMSSHDVGQPINISNTTWDEYDPLWIK